MDLSTLITVVMSAANLPGVPILMAAATSSTPGLSPAGWTAVAGIVATMAALATAFLVHSRSRYAQMELEIRKLRLLQNIAARKAEIRAENLERKNEALRDLVDEFQAYIYAGSKGPLPKLRQVDQPTVDGIAPNNDASLRELEQELATINQMVPKEEK